MDVGAEGDTHCEPLALLYAFSRCKTVTGRNHPFILQSSDNDNIMVVVASTHLTTDSFQNDSFSICDNNRECSDNIINCQSNEYIINKCREKFGIPLVHRNCVIRNGSSNSLVTKICDTSGSCKSSIYSYDESINIHSCNKSSNRCSRSICEKSTRKYSLAVHVPHVIFYAVLFCLLIGACTASCQSETSPTNCSLPDSSLADLGSQTPATPNLNSDDLFAKALNKTDSSTVSKTDSGSSRHNHLSHIADSAPERSVLPSASLPQTGHGEDDTVNKAISVVVPFVCVILLAVIVCVSWKLCHRYKCCHNKACLQKCSTICDNCMSAPYVFQVQGNIKAQNQLSRDSTGLTLVSPHPNTLQLHRTPGAAVQKSHRKPSMPHKGFSSSSASVSRQSSSRSSRHSVGYSPVLRQSSTHAQSDRPSSAHAPLERQSSVRAQSDRPSSAHAPLERQSSVRAQSDRLSSTHAPLERQSSIRAKDVPPFLAQSPFI